MKNAPPHLIFLYIILRDVPVFFLTFFRRDARKRISSKVYEHRISVHEFTTNKVTKNDLSSVVF